ncbi:MAG: hypothetical protein WCZ66_04225 [Sphingomonadaceae bacterium]
MSRLFQNFAVSAVALMLVACGSGNDADSKTTVVRGPEGDIAITTAREGRTLVAPKDMPAFAPAYPGADILSSTTMQAETGMEGSVVTMKTGDSLDKVRAFYDERARSADVAAASVSDTPQGSIRIFQSRDNAGTEKTTIISINEASDGDGSEIAITSGHQQG